MRPRRQVTRFVHIRPPCACRVIGQQLQRHHVQQGRQCAVVLGMWITWTCSPPSMRVSALATTYGMPPRAPFVHVALARSLGISRTPSADATFGSCASLYAQPRPPCAGITLGRRRVCIQPDDRPAVNHARAAPRLFVVPQSCRPDLAQRRTRPRSYRHHVFLTGERWSYRIFLA